MDIIFYKLQNKINDVSKTITLTSTATYQPLTVSGNLKAQASKINPIIDFAKDITYFNGYNYCYIADFGRYYFVDDMISVRTGITTISFRVDVLTSFLTQANIDNIKGYVVRCNNPSHYSTNIADDLLQFKLKPTIIEEEPNSTGTTDIDTTFRISIKIVSSGGTTTIVTPNNITATTMANTVLSSYTTLTIPTDLQDFYNSYTSMNYLYTDLLRASSGEVVHICNNVGLGNIVDECIANDTIKSYVKNVIAFPFEIDSNASGSTFIYGSHNKSYQTGIIDATTKAYTKFMCVDDFNVVLPTNIANYTLDYMLTNNYLIIEYYVPYYGWIKLDASLVVGHRLKLYYIADLRTGSALINLVDTTSKKMIFSGNCQLGVRISLDSTNAYEVARKDEGNTISYILSLLGSMGATAVGAVTGQPMVAVGGMAGIMASTGSMINKELTNIEYAKANLGGDTTAIVSSQKSKIRFTLKEPVVSNTDLSHFRNDYGYPTYKELSISELKYNMSSTQYVQITDLHIADATSYLGDITYNEVEELKRLCASGIYL